MYTVTFNTLNGQGDLEIPTIDGGLKPEIKNIAIKYSCESCGWGCDVDGDYEFCFDNKLDAYFFSASMFERIYTENIKCIDDKNKIVARFDGEQFDALIEEGVKAALGLDLLDVESICNSLQPYLKKDCDEEQFIALVKDNIEAAIKLDLKAAWRRERLDPMNADLVFKYLQPYLEESFKREQFYDLIKDDVGENLFIASRDIDLVCNRLQPHFKRIDYKEKAQEIIEAEKQKVDRKVEGGAARINYLDSLITIRSSE